MDIIAFIAQAKRINALPGQTRATVIEVSKAICTGLTAVHANDRYAAEKALVRAHNRAHNCLSGDTCADW